MSEENPDPPKTDGEAEQPPAAEAAAADPFSEPDAEAPPPPPPPEASEEKAENPKENEPADEKPPAENPEPPPAELEPAPPPVEEPPPPPPSEPEKAEAPDEPPRPEPEPSAPPPPPETDPKPEKVPAEEPPSPEPKPDEPPPPATADSKPEPPPPADEPSSEPPDPVEVELVSREKSTEDAPSKDIEPIGGDNEDSMKSEFTKAEFEGTRNDDNDKVSDEMSELVPPESPDKPDTQGENEASKSAAHGEGGDLENIPPADDTGKEPSEVSEGDESKKPSKSILVDELSKSRSSNKSVTVTDDVLEIDPSLSSIQKREFDLQEQAASAEDADLEAADEEIEEEEDEEEEAEDEVPPLPPPKKRSRYNLDEPEDSDLPDDLIMQEDDRVWTLEKMKLSDRAGRSGGGFVDEGPDAKNACRRSPSRTGGWVLEKMYENTCELKSSGFKLEKGLEELDMNDEDGGGRRPRLSDESGGGPTSDLDDKAWELEKMYRTKGIKGGENRPENIARRSRCDFTNPSRTGGWVLEKPFRDACPVSEESGLKGDENKPKSEIKLDSNTCLRLEQENEKWILEKMYRRNSKLEMAPTVKSAIKQEDCEPCDMDTRKVCRIARKLLIAYDCVTSCDTIGRLPTDQPEEMDDQRTFLEWVWDSFFGWTAVFKSKSGTVVVPPEDQGENITVVDESEPCYERV